MLKASFYYNIKIARSLMKISKEFQNGSKQIQRKKIIEFSIIE